MAASNPFLSLVTPDVLEAQRAAELQAQYGKAPISTQMAAQGGATIRQGFRNAGYGLTNEDIKAKRTQEIMEKAQTSYTDLVKDGKMSADEAQAKTLEDAIKGFSAVGNWEAAISLTQPLNELKKQSLERRKLKAEAVFQEERPDIESGKVDAALQRAEASGRTAEASMLRAMVAQQGLQSQEVLRMAQAMLAQARAADLLMGDDEGGDKKGGKKSVYEQKQRDAVDDTVLGAATAAHLMSTIKEVGIADPGAMTKAGPLSTTIATVAESTKAFMQGQGYSITRTREGNDVSDLVKRNINDQKLQSVTIDLAFAFARTRDPGGRLSNQDVENAIKIVAGTGSPQARLAVLDQSAKNMDRLVREKVKSAKERGYDPTDSAWQTYEEAIATYQGIGASAAGAQPSAAPAVSGPPAGMSREQFLAWKRANPNWKP
jgi:polyhydroxyalkanoate synthesis regulator phasin